MGKKNNKLNREERIIQFNNTHGINTYNYELVPDVLDAKMKIPIVCEKKSNNGSIHGIFYQTVDSHNHGHGCSKCYGNNKSNKEEFTQQALNVYEFKEHNYNYDDFEYKNADTKGKIKCPKHGFFWKTPYKHINIKQGCQECVKEMLSNMFLKTKEEFIEKALIVKEHKDKNYNYDNFVYTGCNEKGNIFCPKKGHGFFKQTSVTHLKGVGCPRCKTSKGESTVRQFLQTNLIQFIDHAYFKACINPITNKLLIFDFYLPQYNLCIEYDGGQHFKAVGIFGGEEGLKNTIMRDNIKNEYCKQNNIKLIRIKYTENVEIKLNEELKHIL